MVESDALAVMKAERLKRAPVPLEYRRECHVYGPYPFPRDADHKAALATLVLQGERLTVRYDNGQLCTFRRRDHA